MTELEGLFPPVSRIIPSNVGRKFWEDDPIISKRMEIFLNSSLCVIHNLSKSSKHRDKFRTTEMKKTLDIYKGSPSLNRRMYSMLSISYMADPEVDMELLQDDYDVISDLSSILEKTLSGELTGFSVQEIVEGVANLSVNAINKDKIIDKTLPLLYAVLERSDDKKLSIYVREVLDGWGFSDGNTLATTEECMDGTETQNTDECCQNSDEKRGTTDDIQMLDNLQCVLSELDGFAVDEVMEIIVTVKDIVYKRNGRNTVLKHMTKQNWPDLLIRIISNVWSSDKTIYLDELRWPILSDTIDILVMYSDGGVEFADLLIEHGALDFMQTNPDAYYQHLKQKILDLDQKTSEFRGQTAANKQPDRHPSIGIVSKQECKPTDEHQPVDVVSSCSGNDNDNAIKMPSSSKASKKERSSGDVVLFTLKPVSEYACVNGDSTMAFRQNSKVIQNRAVFVSNQQLKTSELFELNIDKIDDEHVCSMEFGVCLYNTFPNDTFYEGSGFGKGNGFWFLRDNDLWKDFETVGGGYKLNLRNVNVNDKVGLVKHPDGTMGFSYNGQYQGMAFRNIPECVYVLVATTGRCVQVSVSANTGNTIKLQESSDVSLNEPFETFSVSTIGTDQMKLSKVRTPYGIDFIDEDKHLDMKKVYQKRDMSMNNIYVDTEKALNPLYEINKRSTKGYINENDLMFLISGSVSLYKLHSNPATCVDPVSNDPMKQITTTVKLQGELLKIFQRNSAPDAQFTFPKRLQQVFDVVRPCFDNIKDMSGIVWTGSTSEGFAIADNSGPGMPYVDDEMDLMIPLAIATEDLQITCNNTLEISEQNLGNAEIKLNNPEILITELEDIGEHQKCKDYPLFIWHPSCHPGYVTVAVTEHLQSYTSIGFLKHMCARLKSNGQDHLLLARSKLLEIQENYTRARLNVVQSAIVIDKLDKDNQFNGQLRLVQEGPVQTISVRYQSQEPGGSVLEFDQTVDVAIALKGVDWPRIANPWITRERQWPEKSVVDKIIKDGYHIVPKYHPGGTGIDLEWRLSFSVAERTLARIFTENQRKCYMVFKKLWRKYLKEPKVLSSYHMKTTMFWLCEKTSSDDWMSTNVGERFLDLQNFLIHFLKNHNLPNYFIPENNMINNIDSENINIILAKAQDIRCRQAFHLRDLVAPSTLFNIT